MERLKSIDKLTLEEMMFNYDRYMGLPDGLILLPVPEFIEIKKKSFSVPHDLDEFTKNICYGQRLFLTQSEDNDFGLMIRQMDGYYYPIYTKKKWDADKALLFGKNVITCIVDKIYPVSMHFTSLIKEMIDREQTLLHREPSKMELAAGIEKLNIFSELTSLDFLREAMKCTAEEVLLTPYNECLVRFMLAKERASFQDRYYELMKEAVKPKSKFLKE